MFLFWFIKSIYRYNKKAFSYSQLSTHILFYKITPRYSL